MSMPEGNFKKTSNLLVMILKFDKESRDIQKLEPLIGKQLDFMQKLKDHKYGSNLYNLQKITLDDRTIKEIPSVNSRCNFEKFEKGLLLRINDSQQLYGLVLSNDLTEKLIITRGSEKVLPISLTRLLMWIGVNKETLKKNPLLSSGFYNERFRLEIKTKSESLLLVSNDNNYLKEKAYFLESVLNQKLTVVE